MLREIPIIDWRQQLQTLKPYLTERGGVIRILVSEGSPASNFSKAIRMLMENGAGDRPWTSVQFDALNSNTHYLDDVVAQLDRSLELRDGDSLSGGGGTVQIGTQIEAQTVEISNVEISHQEDEYVRTRRSLARLDRVADDIRARLQTERLGLIFLNSHTYDRDTLSRFRRLLWEERLQAMTELGLLLIDFSDPGQSHGSSWPPNPDVQIDLPERFDDASILHAQEDLEAFALDAAFAVNSGEADVFAATLLRSSASISDLYARLSLLMADDTKLHGP